MAISKEFKENLAFLIQENHWIHDTKHPNFHKIAKNFHRKLKFGYYLTCYIYNSKAQNMYVSNILITFVNTYDIYFQFSFKKLNSYFEILLGFSFFLDIHAMFMKDWHQENNNSHFHFHLWHFKKLKCLRYHCYTIFF